MHEVIYKLKIRINLKMFNYFVLEEERDNGGRKEPGDELCVHYEIRN